MGILSRIDWGQHFPPLTSRTFLSHYLPVSGAVSHTLFAVHIFNPTIVSRLFPVGDLAISNTILFNANLGIGFYVYFRSHMHKLNSWDRVEFSVFASTIFNFGSLLGAVLIKALLPHKTPIWARSCLAVGLSLYLMSRARKYIHHIDHRTRRSSSLRSSPVSVVPEKNGHVPQTSLTNGTSNGNSLHIQTNGYSNGHTNSIPNGF